jgi:hypothetical protein
MAERGAHATTVLDCPSELTGGPARLVAIIVDPFTVLGARRTDSLIYLITETYPPLSETAPAATAPAI